MSSFEAGLEARRCAPLETVVASSGSVVIQVSMLVLLARWWVGDLRLPAPALSFFASCAVPGCLALALLRLGTLHVPWPLAKSGARGL